MHRIRSQWVLFCFCNRPCCAPCAAVPICCDVVAISLTLVMNTYHLLCLASHADFERLWGRLSYPSILRHGVLSFKFCIGEACCARRSNPNVTYGHRLRAYLFIVLLACSLITPHSQRWNHSTTLAPAATPLRRLYAARAAPIRPTWQVRCP